MNRHLSAFGGVHGAGIGRAFQPMLLLVPVCLLAYFFGNIEAFMPVRGQLLVGWAAVFGLVVFHQLKIFRKPPHRIAFLFLSGAITFRYLVWRTTETLYYTGPWDLVGLALLYGAEVYAMTIHFLGLFINIWPLERKIAPMPEDESKYPTVDVFIPTYTEPEDIIRVTATAASQIDYPKDKLRIYILDDGGTAARRANTETMEEALRRRLALKRIASETGADYITRPDNKGAKAGNINHALAHTEGELVLILDCDHVPTRDILKNTVGQFLIDEKLYLVQTPHFFINPSPVERNLGNPDVPYESDMFFRAIHPGFDSWNASYFCGSAAVLKRKYLVAIGGVAGRSITEDAETSVILHGKGLNSAYINRPMVCGLSPETLDDYIIQRTRWAQGMVQIFILNNPLFIKGMTPAQKLCYFNSCVFWFFSFARLIFYTSPALFLILGMKVYHATLPQIFAYAVPHIVATLFTMDFLYGKVRLPLFSEIYESVQSVFLLPAVVSVILNPTKPTFKITPKGATLKETYLNSLAKTFFFVVLINVAALPLAYTKFMAYPLYRDVIILASAWCFINIFLSLLSLGAFWESRQVRKYHRIMGIGEIEVFFPTRNKAATGSVQDISLSGIGVELKPDFTPAPMEEGLLRVSDSYGERYEFRAFLHKIINRGEKYFLGFEFKSDAADYPAIVRYVYGDSAKWASVWDARSNPTGTFDKMLRLMGMGVRASGESLYALAEASCKQSVRIAKATLWNTGAFLRKIRVVPEAR